MTKKNRQDLDELEQLVQEFKEPAPEEDSPLEEKAQNPRGKQNPRRKNKKILFYSLLCFFAAVFLFSSVYLAQYLIRQNRDEATYDELGDIVAGIQGGTGPTEDPLASTPPFVGTTNPPSGPTEPVILPEYQPIYDMNNDTVGWIKIEGTKINYPVMQTPTNSDYYLTHNFDKQKSSVGAIYVREACDVWKPSDNVVIYGHRIINDQMFSPLRNYTSKSFWQSHQYVTFDTLYERHTYQIFAVFKTSANLGQGYSYHRFNDAVDQADFDQFVSKVKELSFYDTGITPQYGDKLITLSTCEYTLDNGRLVVVAVRVS